MEGIKSSTRPSFFLVRSACLVNCIAGSHKNKKSTPRKKAKFITKSSLPDFTQEEVAINAFNSLAESQISTLKLLCAPHSKSAWIYSVHVLVFVLQSSISFLPFFEFFLNNCSNYLLYFLKPFAVYCWPLTMNDLQFFARF